MNMESRKNSNFLHGKSDNTPGMVNGAVFVSNSMSGGESKLHPSSDGLKQQQFSKSFKRVHVPPSVKIRGGGNLIDPMSPATVKCVILELLLDYVFVAKPRTRKACASIQFLPYIVQLLLASDTTKAVLHQKKAPNRDGSKS